MSAGRSNILVFPPPLRRLRWALVVAAACLLMRPAYCADDNKAKESQVKSAFVFNFIQFTDWPESVFKTPEDPIIIGVLDAEPLDGYLSKAIAGKTVKGRALVIRPLAYPGPLTGCQVLYIGTKHDTESAEMVKSIGAANILTIGDTDKFTDDGGIIRFYIEDRKERFEINVAAAERAHLQISSKLLKLAKVVNH